MIYALVILLAGDVTGLPRLSWHASEADCMRQAEIEMAHLTWTGREVESARCQPHRVLPVPRVPGVVR